MKNRFLSLICVLLFCISFITVSAQEDTEIPAEMNAQLDTLIEYTEQIRGLETITPVERAFPTRQETIDYLTRLYDNQLPQAEIDRQTAFYAALGLLPAGIDLRAVYLNLLGSQVAGFYDTETQIMNVLPIGFEGGDTLGLSEQLIFSHEYTHALQDQHFDLDAVMGGGEDAVENPDAALAAISLVEGDATAVMTVYTQGVTAQNPMASLLMLAESLQAGNLTLPPGIPDILLRELLFPYEDGLSFVIKLYQAGEWESVNAAYENVPTTTEQIIHPEKYFEGEGAQTDLLTVVDLSAALPGWTVLFQDAPLGEFYIREHLRTSLRSHDAEAGAAGWGGDAFTLLQNPETGDLAWRLSIQWDTPADTSEFLAFYDELAIERYGVEASDGCYDGGDLGVLCLVEGDQVVTIYAAPTRDLMLDMSGL